LSSAARNRLGTTGGAYPGIPVRRQAR